MRETGIHHDADALYRGPCKRVYQHDSGKDTDIRSGAFCGTPAGIQRAFAEGHVGTLYFSMAYGFASIKAMGHTTGIHV